MRSFVMEPMRHGRQFLGLSEAVAASCTAEAAVPDSPAGASASDKGSR